MSFTMKTKEKLIIDKINDMQLYFGLSYKKI